MLWALRFRRLRRHSHSSARKAARANAPKVHPKTIANVFDPPPPPLPLLAAEVAAAAFETAELAVADDDARLEVAGADVIVGDVEGEALD